MSKEQEGDRLYDIFETLKVFLNLYGALKSGQQYCTP